jgi:bacillolysin
MKSSIKKLIVFTLGTSICINVIGQENQFTKLPDPAIFTSVTENGWMRFKPGLTQNASDVFTLYKKSFGLTEKFSMKTISRNTDAYGITHTRMEEYYNDIPVLFGKFILHEKNNQLLSGNGKLYTSATVKSNAKLNPNEAINKAIQYVNAKKYWWQDTAKENKAKRITRNIKTTYYPVAKQYYYYDTISKQLRLCYNILIQAFDPGKSGYVLIDAIDSKIFDWWPVETLSCDATTVNTVWYGNRIINTYTDFFTSGWDLEDDCTGSTYKVYDYATTFNSIFNSSNNQWLSDRERSAATALWSIRQVRDVYFNFLGRDGHGGDRQNIDMYFDFDFGGNPKRNASFSYDPFGDDRVNIGTGNDQTTINDDVVALDVLAHEFTHGVDQYTANLTYERESGALDESFADIMGKFVESKVLGIRSNFWEMGWDMTDASGTVHLPLRNMQFPKKSNPTTCPDRYLGAPEWQDATGACTPHPNNNDQCGVHTNSGVQNRMFYLLSMGGSGWTNDNTSSITSSTGSNPYSWNIGGIGVDKAGRIAYQAHTNYLVDNSNYFDSRNAWVHAAIDLYGECSFEAIQTGKAWYAVGIGPPTAVGSTFCGTYGNTIFFYNKPGEITAAGSCTVNILPTNNLVQLTSGNRILLLPGFSAPNGSRFNAVINECGFASY